MQQYACTKTAVRCIRYRHASDSRGGTRHLVLLLAIVPLFRWHLQRSQVGVRGRRQGPRVELDGGRRRRWRQVRRPLGAR